MLPVMVAVGLLIAGFVFGRSRVPPPPPLIIQRRSDSPVSDLSTTPKLVAQTATNTTVVEDIYICGARTKKGTPCSRRVHGPVRCWQHKGMPAMLPQEKLRVQ